MSLISFKGANGGELSVSIQCFLVVKVSTSKEMTCVT